MSDRVPLKEDKEEVKPVLPDTPKTHEEPLSYMDDLEYHRVADSLDIDYEIRKDPQIANKLSYLFDWAGEATKSEDRIVRVEAIRNLTKQLGLQMKGKELLSKLYQFTRLDADRRRIERQMNQIG